MTLALLSTAQHVSDINTSIFRSLRLLGVLVCRLYCAVMIQVKLRGLSPHANYTDRAAAAGRRS